MESRRPVDILLVEDNADHAALTMRSLRDGNVLNEIFWVKDGQEAVEFLDRTGRYASPAATPRPGLILLDIRLPKLDGHEVLRHIKSDPSLRTIPVVMLTTSERDDEIHACYEAGVNSYVSKPVKFAEFAQTIKSLKLYWIVVNHLPDSTVRGPVTSEPATASRG
jgi:two-component system, response regulator